jgi:hypothetical protein
MQQFVKTKGDVSILLRQAWRSRQAKTNIQSFLTTAAPDKIQSNDYVFASSVLKKIKGSEESAIKYLKVALNNDTLRSNKVMYMILLLLCTTNLETLMSGD